MDGAAVVGPVSDTPDVTHDIDLADRIRELVATEPGITEKSMFGGRAFLVGGHLAVSASGRGGLLVRVEPGETSALLAPPHVTRFEMRGREMDGWLRVTGDALDADLPAWVGRGVAYARSLPPK